MRIVLHEEIRKLGLEQKEVAKNLKIHEVRLCQIVNSIVNPTSTEIEKIVCYFCKDESDLFLPTNNPKIPRSR